MFYVLGICFVSWRTFYCRFAQTSLIWLFLPHISHIIRLFSVLAATETETYGKFISPHRWCFLHLWNALHCIPGWSHVCASWYDIPASSSISGRLLLYGEYIHSSVSCTPLLTLSLLPSNQCNYQPVCVCVCGAWAKPASCRVSRSGYEGREGRSMNGRISLCPDSRGQEVHASITSYMQSSVTCRHCHVEVLLFLFLSFFPRFFCSLSFIFFRSEHTNICTATATALCFQWTVDSKACGDGSLC